MAFIDFSETAATLVRPTLPLTSHAEHSAEFSPLEKRVLALSHRDGLDTLRPPAKRSWIGRLIFGPQPRGRTLANKRLEALRRLAVEARHHGWRVRSSVIAAAKAAGFTEIQIDRVIDMSGRAAAPAQGNFA